jgi:hypothetical protein
VAQEAEQHLPSKLEALRLNLKYHTHTQKVKRKRKENI